MRPRCTDHGLLFKAAMIRALLDGSKNQTRRLVESEYGNLIHTSNNFVEFRNDSKDGRLEAIFRDEAGERFAIKCPMGAVGDT